MRRLNPTIHREICGTSRGYQAHVYRQEKSCQPCTQAIREYKQKWRAGEHEKAMSNEEIAAEVEHLLKLNQGSHTILKALGYTTNPTTLERRLQRAKRKDLIPRLFHMQDQAA